MSASGSPTKRCKVDAGAVAFVFPKAAGHTNPSLPIARQLVAAGCPVHYLSFPGLQAPIEDTGAKFHATTDWQTELLNGGAGDDVLKAWERMAGEFGELFGSLAEMGPQAAEQGGRLLSNVSLSRALPGTVRFLKHVGAKALVYCPIECPDAVLAARYLGIPSVSLVTTAGPASIASLSDESGLSAEALAALKKLEVEWKPNLDAVASLNAAHGFDPPLSLKVGFGQVPIRGAYSRNVNLVTCIEPLADESPKGMMEAYAEAGVTFEFVGPLIDEAGAKRGGASVSMGGDEGAEKSKSGDAELLAAVRKAKAAGRRVVYVSLGTVITGDYDHYGWKARMPDGKSISGKEMCQSCWGGAFDVFGGDDGWYIVCSIGGQADALEGLRVPDNARCASFIPQIELLPMCDLFLTHGGQNSFMEAMGQGVPLLVCPGFADQPLNAAKVERMGAGLKVDRPETGDEAAVAAYRGSVVAALRRLGGEVSFGEKAGQFVKLIKEARGVKFAVSVVLDSMREGRNPTWVN